MPQLNYRHLLYFWTVAREGSIARACRKLHLTQPAISAQIRQLENSMGEKLFEKSGRGLALTEAGRVAYEYAEEIFRLGGELSDTLRGRPTGQPLRLVVGVTDAFPKLIAHRLLTPALQLPQPVRLVLRDDRPDRLLADLSVHALDVVLTDAPLAGTISVRAYNHLLGECGVSVFATAPLAERFREGFPASLDGAPFLLPTPDTTLRPALEEWFAAEGVRPAVVAEIEDSALLKTFGQAGMGLFAAPSAIEAEVRRQYRVETVGRVEAIRERFYAISVERKLKHPAVVALSEAARSQVFAQGALAEKPRRARKGAAKGARGEEEAT